MAINPSILDLLYGSNPLFGAATPNASGQQSSDPSQQVQVPPTPAAWLDPATMPTSTPSLNVSATPPAPTTSDPITPIAASDTPKAPATAASTSSSPTPLYAQSTNWNPPAQTPDVKGVKQPSPIPLLKQGSDVTPPALAPNTPTGVVPGISSPVGSSAASWLGSTPQTDTATFHGGTPAQANYPIAGYPSGPFSRAIDPNTGVPFATGQAQKDYYAANPDAPGNTWKSQHPTLLRGLAALMAGAAEYGGDRAGHPGQGMAIADRVATQDAAQRQWLANRPAIQQQANMTQQTQQAENALKTGQASYYTQGGPMGGKGLNAGYQWDPVQKTYVPITNLSAVQQSKANNLDATAAARMSDAGLKQNPDGTIVAETDRSKLSLPMQSKLDVQDAEQNLKSAQAELAQAGNDPDSPIYKLKLAQFQLAQQHLSLAYAANDRANRDFYVKNYGIDPGHGGGVPIGGGAPAMGGGPAAGGGPGLGAGPAGGGPPSPRGVPTNPDGTAVAPYSPKQKDFNKNFVNPAQSVEKSYQMMNNAYNEYQQAKANGQDLPTGAQSMVALSTHLSTTFGNVKGARITKDMIQEHLGARSVPDSALVAVQKLTNGDVLSPAQWDAFHGLITQSRNITWNQAASEAGRENLPVNFLPADLQSKRSSPSTKSTSGSGNGALPPGWK